MAATQSSRNGAPAARPGPAAPGRIAAPAAAASARGTTTGRTGAAAPAAQSPLAKRLRAMREAWDASKATSAKGGGGDTTLSAGRHLCRLTDATLKDGDKGASVRFEFTCIEGDETGEKGIRYSGLDTEEHLVYLQRDLRRLGVDVDELDIEQLEGTLAALVEAAPTVRLTVKQNGEYMNVYIDKLVDDAAAQGEGETTAEGEPEAEAEAEADPEAEEPAEAEAEAPAEYGLGVNVSFKLKGKAKSGVIDAKDAKGWVVKDDADGKRWIIAEDQLEILPETVAE